MYQTTRENSAKLMKNEKKTFSSVSKSKLFIMTNIGKKKSNKKIRNDFKPVTPNNRVKVDNIIINAADILIKFLSFFNFIHLYVVLVVQRTFSSKVP